MTFQHENRDHPKRMWSQEARISVYLVDSAKVNTFRSAQVIFKTTPVCSTAVMSIWCLHIYPFRGVSHWLSVSNCRKFIHRFPLNAVEQSEIIFIFPSFVTITENSDLRRRSWPDKSLCWSFMVRRVEEDSGWLLCVCPGGPTGCVTRPLHNFESCRMTTLSLSQSLFGYSWQSSWVSLSMSSAPLALIIPPRFFFPLCLSPFLLSSTASHISLSPRTAVSRLLPTLLCSWSETELICSSDLQSAVHWAVSVGVCVCTHHVGLHVPCVDADMC